MQSGIGGRQVVVLLLACAAVVGVLFAMDGGADTGAQAVESAAGTTTTILASADTEAEQLDPADQSGKAADRAPSSMAAQKTLAVQAGGDDQGNSAVTSPIGSSTALRPTSTTPPETTGTSVAESATTLPASSSTASPATTPPATGETPAPGSGTKPVIHLTFDDGPSELTPRVMDLLEKYNGRATFFVMGQAVEDHPDIAAQIVERGHAIANHSYDHMDWRQAGAREDIIKTQGIILAATGVTPSCARPPFGAQDENLLSILGSLGMETWRWDLSAEDHTEARYQVEQTLNTLDATPNIRGAEGKIVLQHDSDLLVGPSIDGLEAWLAKNADRYEFKAINGCLDYQ